MAKVNRNYCKPDADMKPVYAPAAFRMNGVDYWHPTAADYAAAGYKPLSPDWPVDPAPDGQHWERTDKIEADGTDGYRWTYRLVDDPPAPPRTFSKYRLVAALMQAEVWPQVKAWIESQAGAYDLYLAAEDISEDEQLFADGIAAVKAAFGWTDDEVEELLAKCVKEGY